MFFDLISTNMSRLRRSRAVFDKSFEDVEVVPVIENVHEGILYGKGRFANRKWKMPLLTELENVF
jgi:hypothetical protein